MARQSSSSDPDAAFTKQRSSNDAELDITPMIDVTFLLLIFFMVTSTMQPDEVLDIPTSVHGLGVEANSATGSVLAQFWPSSGPVLVHFCFVHPTFQAQQCVL